MNEDKLVDEVRALDREKDDVIRRVLDALSALEAAEVSDMPAALECRSMLEDEKVNSWFTAAALWGAPDVLDGLDAAVAQPDDAAVAAITTRLLSVLRGAKATSEDSDVLMRWVRGEETQEP